jgi:hypothetical protein
MSPRANQRVSAHFRFLLDDVGTLSKLLRRGGVFRSRVCIGAFSVEPLVKEAGGAVGTGRVVVYNAGLVQCVETVSARMIVSNFEQFPEPKC